MEDTSGEPISSSLPRCAEPKSLVVFIGKKGAVHRREKLARVTDRLGHTRMASLQTGSEVGLWASRSVLVSAGSD